MGSVTSRRRQLLTESEVFIFGHCLAVIFSRRFHAFDSLGGALLAAAMKVARSSSLQPLILGPRITLVGRTPVLSHLYTVSREIPRSLDTSDGVKIRAILMPPVLLSHNGQIIRFRPFYLASRYSNTKIYGYPVLDVPHLGMDQ
jgi:hypothetical protein